MMAFQAALTLCRDYGIDLSHLPQVFSKQRAVNMLSRKSRSATGLIARPAFEQSGS